MAMPQSFSHLVVVGPPTANIETLAALVAALPAAFPAPIVLGRPANPDYAHQLVETLKRQTPLPIHLVDDQLPLEPGAIFLVPADRRVAVTRHAVHIEPRQEDQPGLLVNPLFETAADAFGEYVVAVLLGGAGPDCVAGARHIKARDGTVVAPKPDSRSFSSIARSPVYQAVDLVEDVADIGPLLDQFITLNDVPISAEKESLLMAFLERTRARSGIDFSSYTLPAIQRRLARRMAATRRTRLGDYLVSLERDVQEYRRLISSFMVKSPEFFGDQALFRYLRQELLPGLVRTASEHDNEIRLWATGCATGEEAYSLALAVTDALGDTLERYSVRLFATDVDGDALSFARRAAYPGAALTNLPPDFVARYFHAVDGMYELDKRVRSLVVFGEHDLARQAPFQNIDLVLCRDVLSVFTPELQQRALQLFHYALREGGHLVLGRSEAIALATDVFASTQPHLNIYRRKEGRVWPRPGIGTDTALKFRQPSFSHQLFAGDPATRYGEVAAIDAMLAQIPVGIVLVDSRYDVRSITPEARRLLGITVEAIGADLLHLLRGMAIAPLRGAIDAALNGATPDPLDETAVQGAIPDETRFLSIAVMPASTNLTNGMDDMALLWLTDVTTVVEQRRTIERLEGTIGAMRRGQNELASTNEQLLQVGLALRGANEHFLADRQELQAIAEETQTLNEELRAANEELETLNEELQATNEELNIANSDLLARGDELQEQASILAAQHNRVAAILHNLSEAVLVVDRSGQTLLTSASFDRLLHEISVDYAPEDEHGIVLPFEAQPRQRAARGETFAMTFALADRSGTRRWFEAEGCPVHSHAATGDSVLVFREVTDRMRWHNGNGHDSKRARASEQSDLAR
jgi:two-component system CheB/CheR fusion protein